MPPRPPKAVLSKPSPTPTPLNFACNIYAKHGADVVHDVDAGTEDIAELTTKAHFRILWNRADKEPCKRLEGP